jgi:hypothetical protein
MVLRHSITRTDLTTHTPPVTALSPDPKDRLVPMVHHAARVRWVTLALFAVVLGCIFQTSKATYPQPSKCRSKCGNNCCPGEKCIRGGNDYNYKCQKTQCQTCGVLKYGSCMADSSQCPQGQKCVQIAKSDSFQCTSIDCGTCGKFMNGACAQGMCRSATCRMNSEGKFNCETRPVG